MLFHTSGKDIQSIIPELSIGGGIIERVQNFNFLGLKLNEKMSWKPHVDMIANKISKYIGVLNRLKRYLPSVKNKWFFLPCTMNLIGPIGITVDPSPRGVYMKRYPVPSQRWMATRGLDIDNWEVLRLIGILKLRVAALLSSDGAALTCGKCRPSVRVSGVTAYSKAISSYSFQYIFTKFLQYVPLTYRKGL